MITDQRREHQGYVTNLQKIKVLIEVTIKSKPHYTLQSCRIQHTMLPSLWWFPEVTSVLNTLAEVFSNSETHNLYRELTHDQCAWIKGSQRWNAPRMCQSRLPELLHRARSPRRETLHLEYDSSLTSTEHSASTFHCEVAQRPHWFVQASWCGWCTRPP